jgi:hypothetical protein
MPTKLNTKNKDKPNIIGSPSLSSLNPVQEGSGARTAQSMSKSVPKQAVHILGAPPVIHNPPAGRTVSASHTGQVPGTSNVGGRRNGSTMPRDKSAAIPAPKLSPRGPPKLFSTVAKGAAQGQGPRSPKPAVPPGSSLAKGYKQPKGLEQPIPAQVTQTELTLSEGDFLAGLNDSREEQEVEDLASPKKPGRGYSSSEYKLSNTGFLGQAGRRCPERA